MISDAVCQVCGVKDNLMLCSRCRQVFYCSKEHQIADWKRHKKNCCSTSVLPSPTSKPDCFSDLSCLKNATVSSQSAPRNNCKFVKNIAQKQTDRLDISNINNSNMPLVDYEKPAHTVGNIAYDHLTEICLASLSKHKSEREELGIIDEVCRNVIQDMDSYGVCVVDNFLGKERGERVLREVKDMYSKGLFQDGQLVSNKANKDLKTIRSDRITWIDGTEPDCSNIDMLISEVDTIILKSNKMENNGKMGDFVINGRTKAMVACYPGDGAHYVKHVDNPNKDGRCITAIYYLNPEWDTERDGGLLRIFPEGWEDQVADIAPEFDRILFFWSDRRNPHEVQPSYKTRYAITLWYFDAAERKEACNLYINKRL